jgi:hypothetical protein
VKPFVVVCALTFVCSAVLPGQTVSVPAKWIGTWELNVSKSTFGKILVPGAPPDLAIVSQRVRIEKSGQAIRLFGDTVVSDSSGPHSGHDDTALSLDGSETVLGPFSLSFRPIDGSTFEVTSKVNIPGSNIGEVSRFSFSADGRTLTETKTQTEREVVPAGADKAAGAVIKTSEFVLVFSRIPEA